MEKEIRCRNCGAAYYESMQFCPICGEPYNKGTSMKSSVSENKLSLHLSENKTLEEDSQNKSYTISADEKPKADRIPSKGKSKYFIVALLIFGSIAVFFLRQFLITGHEELSQSDNEWNGDISSTSDGINEESTSAERTENDFLINGDESESDSQSVEESNLNSSGTESEQSVVDDSTRLEEYLMGKTGSEIGSETIQAIRSSVNGIDDLLSEYATVDEGDSIRYYTRNGKNLKKVLFRPTSRWSNGEVTGIFREYYYNSNEIIFIAAYSDQSNLEKDLLRFYFQDGKVVRYAQAGEGIHDYDPAKDADEFFFFFNEMKEYYLSAVSAVSEEHNSSPVEDVQPKLITIIDGIQAPETDFLYPESSSRPFTQEELDSFEASSRDEMHFRSQMAINEIFVRYGFQFNSSSATATAIRERFGSKDWYQQAKQHCPSQDADNLMYNYMNSVELQNINTINQWQKDHGVYY